VHHPAHQLANGVLTKIAGQETNSQLLVPATRRRERIFHTGVEGRVEVQVDLSDLLHEGFVVGSLVGEAESAGD
jgi:hypothetical protein